MDAVRPVALPDKDAKHLVFNHDDRDLTGLQAPNDLGDVDVAVARDAASDVVAARLRDDDPGSGWHGSVETTEHPCRGIAADSFIGNAPGISPCVQHRLQLCWIGVLRGNAVGRRVTPKHTTCALAGNAIIMAATKSGSERTKFG